MSRSRRPWKLCSLSNASLLPLLGRAGGLRSALLSVSQGQRSAGCPVEDAAVADRLDSRAPGTPAVQWLAKTDTTSPWRSLCTLRVVLRALHVRLAVGFQEVVQRLNQYPMPALPTVEQYF